MTDIPEDIMREAERLARMPPSWKADGNETLIAAIAYALYAERFAAEKRGAERVMARMHDLFMGATEAAAIRKEGRDDGRKDAGGI